MHTNRAMRTRVFALVLALFRGVERRIRARVTEWRRLLRSGACVLCPGGGWRLRSRMHDAIHRRYRSLARHSRHGATERTLLYRTPDSQSRAQGVMRPLEESELEQVLTKLFQFVGKNIENILQRTDAPHSLRLHKKRVYYVRDDVMKRAVSIGRDQLVSLGLCIGKFTHSDKFKLMVGALDLLAAHAKYKVRARGKECACIAHAR